MSEADDGVDLWCGIEQFCAHSLAEASCDDDFFYRTFVFEFRSIFDDLHCFVSCGLDESACVYDDNVSVIGCGCYEEPGLYDICEHTFAVYDVLRAAECMEANGYVISLFFAGHLLMRLAEIRRLVYFVVMCCQRLTRFAVA